MTYRRLNISGGDMPELTGVAAVVVGELERQAEAARPQQLALAVELEPGPGRGPGRPPGALNKRSVQLRHELDALGAQPVRPLAELSGAKATDIMAHIDQLAVRLACTKLQAAQLVVAINENLMRYRYPQLQSLKVEDDSGGLAAAGAAGLMHLAALQAVASRLSDADPRSVTPAEGGTLEGTAEDVPGHVP